MLEDRCLLSAGALDPTFGSGGYAKPAASINGSADAVAIYPNAGAGTDGDVVAAGTVIISNGSKSNNDFALVRTFTFATTGWAPGSYTLFAQAEDSYGVFGDPFALPFTVQ